MHLASAPLLFCQKADAKLSSQDNRVEGKPTASQEVNTEQRAECVTIAVLHSDFIFEMYKNVQEGNKVDTILIFK